MNFKAKILRVAEGSVAEESGLKAGDVLLSINGEKIRDIIDYQILTDDEEIRVEVLKKGDSSRAAKVSYNSCKQVGKPFGLKFQTSIFDKVKTCTNKCIFCFVDQLPKNLRKSLYLKDDDFRLSFLYGNFITLTNMSDEDINRIIKQRLSPLYVSLHATDLNLRKVMIRPRGSDKTLSYFRELLDAGIEVHLQIVVCPGLNDGETLFKTTKDLENNFSQVASVGIVPVGLTCYRENVPPLRLFTSEEMSDIVKEVTSWQGKFTQTKGTPWVFLADEFYLRPGLSLPPNSHYLSTGILEQRGSSDYPQLENGIGISTLFLTNVSDVLKETSFSKAKKTKFTVLTGELSYPVVKEAAERIQLVSYGKISFNVLVVPNNFFGRGVTVTGLLAAKDILAFLEKKDISGRILIPDVLLNSQSFFLDEVSSSELVEKLQAEVEFVPSTGRDFVEKLKELVE